MSNGEDVCPSPRVPTSYLDEAVLDGIRALHHPNDQAQREASIPVLEALYAYCAKKVAA